MRDTQLPLGKNEYLDMLICKKKNLRRVAYRGPRLFQRHVAYRQPTVADFQRIGAGQVGGEDCTVKTSNIY